ncbi:MAG: urease accessory protein UreE [Chitinispirillales bacterium]|jgi:urease accessory protein|nr:urease accessory protein UreE [Chitinispirillales bacterium]
MIIEKIIGPLPDRDSDKPIETVPFEWFEQNNKILKKVSSSGADIGLRLSEPLYDGAILFEDNDKIIALSLKPCELTKVNASSMREMGRVCFELGNRHLPLSIGDAWVCTPYDSPTFEHLRKLGFSCERITEKFTPEAAARGHRHHHE